jgi:TRAP-type transport system periplasmic protein
MTRARPIVSLLLIGAALGLLAGCGGASSDKAGGKSARRVVVLSLASYLGDPGEVERFTGEVSRLSGGSIRIDVRSGWRRGQVAYENGLIGDVRAGKADLGVVGSRAWDSVGVTSLRALTAPLLIDSYALEDRVVNSPMIGEMLNGLRRLGLVGLGVLPGPLRKPLGVTHPLLKPSDYAGLTIGVQQSQVAGATMRALGARPVWFASQAPITGFGGIEGQVGAIQGEQYDRVGKFLTANVNLWPRPLVLFANHAAFAKLTRFQQRILARAVADTTSAETKSVITGERTDTAILCRRQRLRFLTASSAEVRALRRAVQLVYDQLDRDRQTRLFIAQIEALRSGATTERSPGCGNATQLANQRGPLDGVYGYTSTVAELRASGVDASAIVPENYGTFTFVFDRGRFAQTQENQQACTWAYGTIAVKGDRLEQQFTGAGGIAPTNANVKPGEFSVWHWSLYRDKLKLVAISPPDLPRATWTRISTSPSARFLSKRCPPPANALPG